MIATPLYIRVVPQDKDRGYMLLAGFDNKIVQSTCSTYTTLSDLTRSSLDEATASMQKRFNASEVKDCTAPSLQRKLKKMFGEV